MNNYSLGGKYSKAVLTHFEQFVRRYSLFTKESSLILSVSGGVDSMVMLDLIFKLRRFGYSNNLKVVNFNHKTRKGQDDEAILVSNYSSLLGIPSLLIDIEGLNINSNFEALARDKRYEHLDAICEDEDLILLGQHIDDSFEWSLMQQFKSSNLTSSIGIPLINGKKRRPLMSLTKNQIRRYAQENEIPYLDDPTNDNSSHERNYIRNVIVQGIKKKHPQYLKHYVNQKTELSEKLALSALKQDTCNFNIQFNDNYVYYYSISESVTSISKEQIIEGLNHLNPNGRSNLAKQIINIQNSLLTSKVGPISLGSGIKVYIDFNCLLMTRSEGSNNKEYQSINKLMNYNEYKEYLLNHHLTSNPHENFPYLVDAGKKFKFRSFKVSYNVDNVKNLKDNKINFYPALKLLKEWSKKRNRKEKLPIKFLV